MNLISGWPPVCVIQIQVDSSTFQVDFAIFQVHKKKVQVRSSTFSTKIQVHSSTYFWGNSNQLYPQPPHQHTHNLQNEQRKTASRVKNLQNIFTKTDLFK